MLLQQKLLPEMLLLTEEISVLNVLLEAPNV